MKIAVGYVRCSTDEQGATSIPQQRAEIERWAAANQYRITEWFCDEGKSGTDFLNRPAFSSLVKQVERNPNFRYVIAYDESRWGRAVNPRENAYWKIHFERHNVKVRLVHSGSKNENDIGSYVMEVVESAEASEYSKKLSRAIRRGMMAEQQGKYSRGGTAPYGYKRVAIDLQSGEKRELKEGQRSVPRQEKVVWELGQTREVETVRKIFELKVKGYGVVAIADMLNQESVPSPRRGRWRNRDNRWTGSTIKTILENPVYVGDRVYNRLSFSKFLPESNAWTTGSKRINDKSEWIVVPKAHDAIVSRELFTKATASQEKHPIKPNRNYYGSTYLLTGLVRCKSCSYAYQGFSHKQSGKRYYVDGGYINKGANVCRWHSIRQEKLESFVLASIRDIFLSPNLERRIEALVYAALCNGPSESAAEIERVKAALRETSAKIQGLLRFAESGIQLESVADRILELEGQQKSMRQRLASIERENLHVRYTPDQIKQAVVAFLSNFERDFELMPLADKKSVLRRIVETIIVDEKAGIVKCYIRRLPSIDQLGDSYTGDSSFILGRACSLNGNRTRI